MFGWLGSTSVSTNLSTSGADFPRHLQFNCFPEGAGKVSAAADFAWLTRQSQSVSSSSEDPSKYRNEQKILSKLIKFPVSKLRNFLVFFLSSSEHRANIAKEIRAPDSLGSCENISQLVTFSCMMEYSLVAWYVNSMDSRICDVTVAIKASIRYSFASSHSAPIIWWNKSDLALKWSSWRGKFYFYRYISSKRAFPGHHAKAL